MRVWCLKPSKYMHKILNLHHASSFHFLELRSITRSFQDNPTFHTFSQLVQPCTTTQHSSSSSSSSSFLRFLLLLFLHLLFFFFFSSFSSSFSSSSFPSSSSFSQFPLLLFFLSNFSFPTLYSSLTQFFFVFFFIFFFSSFSLLFSLSLYLTILTYLIHLLVVSSTQLILLNIFTHSTKRLYTHTYLLYC